MSSIAELENSCFRFERTDGTFLSLVILKPDGTLGGTQSPNERFWQVDGENLVFLDAKHEATTLFERSSTASKRLEFVGTYLPQNRVNWHRLISTTITPDLLDELNVLMFGRRRDGYDIVKCAQLAAAMDSANYYSDHMLQAKPFDDKMSLLKSAMQSRTVKGLVLEFGVFRGGTINHIAGCTDETVYGFDVFTGLPENWRPGYPEGTFALQELPKVRPNVDLIVGLFEDTTVPFLKDHPGPASLIHIDCDLYSATQTLLKDLTDRIVAGTVIVFDEYFNYPGWRQHEIKAFHEFLARTGKTYKYLSFVRHHQQVAVQITG